MTNPRNLKEAKDRVAYIKFIASGLVGEGVRNMQKAHDADLHTFVQQAFEGWTSRLHESDVDTPAEVKAELVKMGFTFWEQ